MKLSVTGRTLQITEKELLVSNTVKDYTASFDFDESWDGWTPLAVFYNKNSKVNKEQRLDKNGSCLVPWEVLTPGCLQVGVYGTNGEKIRPTLWSESQNVRPGTEPGESAKEPTPSVYEQILEELKRIEESGGGSGVSIESIEQTTTSTEDGGINVITITLSNGDTETFMVQNGSKGSQGEVGPAGPQGETGPQGEKGETGPAGPQGDQGIPGEKGDTGATGPQGPAGENGKDGYSPIRGTDYWTEEDKNEIKSYVDEAILGGAW